MFGLEYIIGFIKVFIKLGLSIVWAIPMNIVWNRLAPIYFEFLPAKWLNVPYWHIVGLTMIIVFVGQMIDELIPKIVKVEQSVESKNDK